MTWLRKDWRWSPGVGGEISFRSSSHQTCHSYSWVSLRGQRESSPTHPVLQSVFSTLSRPDFTPRSLALAWRWGGWEGTVGSSQVLDRPASFSFSGPASRLSPLMSFRLLDLLSWSSQPLQRQTSRSWLHTVRQQIYLPGQVCLSYQRRKQWRYKHHILAILQMTNFYWHVSSVLGRVRAIIFV